MIKILKQIALGQAVSKKLFESSFGFCEERPWFVVLWNIAMRWRMQHYPDAPRIDFSQVDRVCGRFEGIDFRNVNFCQAKLGGSSFRRSNLQGAVFLFADLFNTDFKGADLQEVDFTSAFLKQSNLQETKLKDTIFDEAYLVYVYLRGAQGLRRGQLDRAILFEGEAPLPKIFANKFTENDNGDVGVS